MPCFPSLCGKKSSLIAEPLPLRILEGNHNVKFYTYKELQYATDNFSKSNKIGEGGFGPVYKGKLRDGTMVAIKLLSPESRQGLDEFVTELTVLADVDHDNLVKLLGCCIEQNNRILVSGYLENNSLAQTLLGMKQNTINFSWPLRRDIGIGIAKGLAFLHEEVKPYIVHRDIKASNILLDKDLTAKIADFGLAKLIPPNMTHISTKVAGTLGYLAPEYAVRGHLTRKADIYSFGVLLLEIVCGRCNKNKWLPAGDQYLLQRAWMMLEKGKLVELVDESFRGDLDIDEASRFLKIALLCTQQLPKLRPTMPDVVRMLQGQEDVDKMDVTPPGLYSENASSFFSPGSASSSLPSDATDPTCATITFTSISARSK